MLNELITIYFFFSIILLSFMIMIFKHEVFPRVKPFLERFTGFKGVAIRASIFLLMLILGPIFIVLWAFYSTLRDAFKACSSFLKGDFNV